MKKIIYAIMGGIMTAVLWGYVFYSIADIYFGVISGSVFGAAFIATAVISLYMHTERNIE